MGHCLLPEAVYNIGALVYLKYMVHRMVVFHSLDRYVGEKSRKYNV